MLAVLIRSFLHDDGGATAIEYGLIVALVAMAILGTLAVLGDSVQGLFDNGAAEVLNKQAGKIS